MPDIIRGDASRIDELEPLWLALREHHASITEHWGPLRPPEESWGRRRKNYVDILDEGGLLFIAEEDGAIVGHAMCEIEQGGGSPTWAWPPDFVAIVDLIVLPDRRGQGVGEALMSAVEQEARERGIAALDLMVAAPNENACRFYERQGFRADLITYRKPL